MLTQDSSRWYVRNIDNSNLLYFSTCPIRDKDAVLIKCYDSEAERSCKKVVSNDDLIEYKSADYFHQDCLTWARGVFKGIDEAIEPFLLNDDNARLNELLGLDL